MPQLEFENLLEQMLAAAKSSIGSEWGGVKELTSSSLEKLAKNIVAIQKLQLEGKIDEDDARSMMLMQKNALEAVLLTEKIIAKKGLENLINAVFSSVATIVNKALGWAIL